MTSPVDDVAFLLRSPNRVAVLKALADGPQSRDDLVDGTPASRVTIGRILHDFELREWVERSGRAYEPTTRGRLLARELSAFLDRLRAIERLDPVLSSFAVDRIDVPLAAFGDATVTVPTQAEPNRHHRRIGAVGERAETARMYTQGVTREASAIHRTAVSEREQTLELVLTADALAAARADESLWDEVSGLVESSAFFGTVAEALSVPFVGLFDGSCFIGIADERGVPTGVVESTNDDVVGWAEQTLDDLVARATPVDSARGD